MGGAIKVTRTDMSAKDLRRASKRTKDGRVVRRLLAIALVLDGVGWHGAKCLQVPDKITLIKLPPYSPELNPMENV